MSCQMGTCMDVERSKGNRLGLRQVADGMTTMSGSCRSCRVPLRPNSIRSDVGVGLAAGNKARAGVLASKTKLKKPTIISSQLCWPQMTVFVGSGFSGLSAELSKCAVHSIFVPFGKIERRVEVVPELPAPIVFRHAEKRFACGRRDRRRGIQNPCRVCACADAGR